VQERAERSAHRVPFAALDREHEMLSPALRASFDRVLRSGRFVLAEEVERFEAAWADTCRTAHCVGVGSGTAALSLLLRGAGVGRGDEVIVPAHTFIATALAVVDAGATPVLCDVDVHTGLIDLEAVRAATGPRTAAVIAVHLYGQMCQMRPLARFARARGLLLVEDAAQAHGARCDGRPAGASGAGAAFSFYTINKIGALGDAGAVCTNDGAVAERVRRLRDLGRLGRGEHLLPGVNERLDELQAALLSAKLPHLERANALRRRHAGRYRALLDGRVALLEERPSTPCVYHLFPIRVPDRDSLARRLRHAGIDVGVHYSPALHRQPALAGRSRNPAELPNADAWAAQELSLPMSPALEPAEIERVAEACLEAVDA
jgi:dTDP-3-amino-3,4,6-trideoxy-alpha-D-glucose transaminase